MDWQKKVIKMSLKIDFMNSEGDQSKVATMSKQLVANGNDLVVGIATPAAQGLASATKDLPVIMAAITDPIGANLVKDLKKPGGNITGVSDHNPAQQQVELIKALTPNVKQSELFTQVAKIIPKLRLKNLRLMLKKQV